MSLTFQTDARAKCYPQKLGGTLVGCGLQFHKKYQEIVTPTRKNVSKDFAFFLKVLLF